MEAIGGRGEGDSKEGAEESKPSLCARHPRVGEPRLCEPVWVGGEWCADEGSVGAAAMPAAARGEMRAEILRN